MSKISQDYIRSAIKRASKKEAKSTLRHFRRDGWDICWDGIKDDIFYAAFGFHMSDVALVELAKLGPNWMLKLKDGSMVITKNKEAAFSGLTLKHMLPKKKKRAKRVKAK